MKKTKRLNIIYRPLDVSLSLLIHGGSLTQTHCAETSEFIPDRELTPLVIRPQMYVHDSDGLVESGHVQMSEMMWYALPENIAAGVTDESYLKEELSQYLITAATAGYAVGQNGELTVSANIPYRAPVVLVFAGCYWDGRSGKVLRVHASATLNTTSVALPATLSLDKPVSWTYNPMEDSGTRSVAASLRLGGKSAETAQCNVRYWWYKAVDGAETLVDANDDLFYESGQNTAILTIDPRYLSHPLRLICKAEYALPGENLPQMPSETSLKAETVVARRYPNYDYENFVHGGVEISSSAEKVKNECVVTVGRRVLESPSEWFSVKWSIKRAVYGAEWLTIGYGDSIRIPASEFADGADVGLELEEREALGAMSVGNEVICDNGAVITL